MGQAKLRGSREERVAQALAKKAAEEASKPPVNRSPYGSRRAASRAMLLTAVTGLALAGSKL